MTKLQKQANHNSGRTLPKMKFKAFGPCMFEFIVSSLLFMLILQGQASAAGLTGSWDCLGSFVFSAQQTLTGGQVVVNTFQDDQLIPGPV